jgi:hypothetical protein
MKKLLLAVSFIAAIIQLSSCTSDSIQDTEIRTNKINPEIISADVLDSIGTTNPTIIDIGDKDKTKT